MRALLLVLALTACSKKAVDDKGPGCPAVVDHMVTVMKAGLKGHEGVNLGDRDQMIAQCESRRMSADERRCMATAQDLVKLASCHPKPAQPVPIDVPARPVVPAPATPAATTGSGSAR